MPRVKKDAKTLNVKLDRQVHEDLERFCEETGMSKTIAVEKVLRKYLDDYFDLPRDKRALF